MFAWVQVIDVSVQVRQELMVITLHVVAPSPCHSLYLHTEIAPDTREVRLHLTCIRRARVLCPQVLVRRALTTSVRVERGVWRLIVVVNGRPMRSLVVSV